MQLITNEKIKDFEKSEIIEKYKRKELIYKRRESSKSKVGTKWIICLLLCIFCGYSGLHRFYAGKIVTGFLYLFTFGFIFIGPFIDLIKIVSGNFRNKQDEYFVRP